MTAASPVGASTESPRANGTAQPGENGSAKLGRLASSKSMLSLYGETRRAGAGG